MLGLKIAISFYRTLIMNDVYALIDKKHMYVAHMCSVIEKGLQSARIRRYNEDRYIICILSVLYTIK
jgi:hypothetical protein